MIWKFFKHAGYHKVAGEYVPWPTLRDAFRAFVESLGDDPKKWTRARIQAELGNDHPIGRGPGNKTVVGNVSLQYKSPRRWIRGEGGTVRLQKPTAAA